MKMVIEDPVMDPEAVDRAVNALVNDSHSGDFRDILVWMVKTGLGEEGAREKLINDISTCISKEVSKGLVQVTIQELEGETEFKAKYEQDLTEIYPHVDFIVKSGALDVWTTKYWFKVSSKVKLDNVAIRLKNEEITGIKSGIMQAFVTLAYCGHARENPKPFILFTEKKVLDLDLAKVVTFK